MTTDGSQCSDVPVVGVSMEIEKLTTFLKNALTEVCRNFFLNVKILNVCLFFPLEKEKLCSCFSEEQ